MRFLAIPTIRFPLYPPNPKITAYLRAVSNFLLIYRRLGEGCTRGSKKNHHPAIRDLMSGGGFPDSRIRRANCPPPKKNQSHWAHVSDKVCAERKVRIDQLPYIPISEHGFKNSITHHRATSSPRAKRIRHLHGNFVCAFRNQFVSRAYRERGDISLFCYFSTVCGNRKKIKITADCAFRCSYFFSWGELKGRWGYRFLFTT